MFGFPPLFREGSVYDKSTVETMCTVSFRLRKRTEWRSKASRLYGYFGY